MQNDHNDNCNCFDCVDTYYKDSVQAFGNYLNKFYNNTVKMPLWTKPVNGSIYKVYEPGRLYLTIVEIEKQSDGKYWAKNKNGLWFNFNAYGNSMREIPNEPVDPELKQVVLKNVVGTTVPGGTVLVKTAEAGTKIVEGAGEVIEGGLSAIGFIGKNLKWILLIAILLIAAYIFRTIKTGLK